MSKDRRGTGGGLTSEQFHDKFCDRTKDEDSLATKLAGWYKLERCLLVFYIMIMPHTSHSSCNMIPSKSNFMSMLCYETFYLTMDSNCTE